MRASDGITGGGPAVYFADGAINLNDRVSELIALAPGFAGTSPDGIDFVATGDITLTLQDGAKGDEMHIILAGGGNTYEAKVTGTFALSPTTVEPFSANELIFNQYSESVHLVWAGAHWEQVGHAKGVELFWNGQTRNFISDASTAAVNPSFGDHIGVYATTSAINKVLEDGYVGQVITLQYFTGTGVCTLTPDNLVGGTTIVLDAVGENTVLQFTPDGWVETINGGATVA